MPYATKIIKLRDEMVLIQEEFGEVLGVSLVTVNRWENCKFEPAIKIKRKLRELFKEYKIDEGDS